VSLDVSPDLRRRLRMAAARRDTTMSRYVLDAVQEQLRRDLGAQDLLALTARADPVLAELWDNRRDSESARSSGR
jgi:uncharacterized protein (DUF1778 family)